MVEKDFNENNFDLREVLKSVDEWNGELLFVKGVKVVQNLTGVKMNFLTVLQLSKCGIESIEKLARIQMPRLTSLSLSFFFLLF